MKSNDGYCFIWEETEGGATANEFTTILRDFIEQLSLTESVEVIFYSYGCGYQNRNCTLANGLYNLALRLRVTITQKYLVKGHTQMECDMIHSTMENRLKYTDIVIPSNYSTVAKQARIQQP